MKRGTTIGVIPSRFASQRLPAKPLIDLFGKSMVQRVYEQAAKAKTLDRVVVATDDQRIVDAVRAFGGEVMLTSADIRSGSDRVAAVAELIPGDVYVNIQGDEPLIAPQMIDEAVRILKNNADAAMSTLARRIEHVHELTSPSTVKVVVDARSRALFFSRSPIPFLRDAGPVETWLPAHPFLKHIGLYVYRSEFLRTYVQLPVSSLERAEKLEQLRVLENGYSICVGVTTYDSIPVDTQQDVDRVVSILRSRND
jgi:3-deoxy-manno-octulosonate cytidylyltransferase (CMP-KDO synthetase)